jgi:hypothetical protein
MEEIHIAVEVSMCANNTQNSGLTIPWAVFPLISLEDMFMTLYTGG